MTKGSRRMAFQFRPVSSPLQPKVLRQLQVTLSVQAPIFIVAGENRAVHQASYTLGPRMMIDWMRLEKIQRLFHFVEHRVHAAAAVSVDGQAGVSGALPIARTTSRTPSILDPAVSDPACRAIWSRATASRREPLRFQRRRRWPPRIFTIAPNSATSRSRRPSSCGPAPWSPSASWGNLQHPYT